MSEVGGFLRQALCGSEEMTTLFVKTEVMALPSFSFMPGGFMILIGPFALGLFWGEDE